MHLEKKVSFLLIAVISVVFNLITLLSFLDNRNTVHQEIESADLDSLTGAQLLDYFLWTNRSSCGLIHDFGGVLFTALDGRFRAFDGQKAVCLDKKIAPQVLIPIIAWSTPSGSITNGLLMKKWKPTGVESILLIIRWKPMKSASIIHLELVSIDWG